MKYKTLTFSAVISIVGMTANAQKFIDKETLRVNDSVTLYVGSDIMVNKPAGFDFSNIEENKSGFGLGNISKIANVGMAAGGTLLGVGGATSSIGAIHAGATVAQTAGIASSAGWTADAVSALHASDKAKSIVGKKMRILKFKKEGNEKRGEHYYAIVAGPGKTDYKVEVDPALSSQEIILLNQ